MIYKILLVFILSTSVAYSADAIIKTDNNEFHISYNHRTAIRIIPHGLIDEAKDHITAIDGVDNIISFERTFHIGENNYGYIVSKQKNGIDLLLISCSKGNESFVTVSGVVKKGDWKYEVIKLLELSTKALEEYDRNNAKKNN
jgi:hypothetical protein